MITEEQIKFKKGRCGASDTASALGVNPFETPAGFVLRTLEMIEPEPFVDFGTCVENGIADAYTQKTGRLTHPVTKTFVHPKHNWLIAHPDRETPGRLVEVKSVGPHMGYKWGEDGDPSGVPDYVMIQCIQQATLTNSNFVDVAAYFGGNDLRVFPLEISKANKDDLLEAIVTFWQTYVEKKTIPPVDYQDLSNLSKLYPKDGESKIMMADEETEKMIWLYGNADKAHRDAEKELESLKAQMQLAMGDAAFLCIEEDKPAFSWKKSKDSKGTDWENAFQELATLVSHDVHQTFLNDIIQNHEKVTKKGSRKFLFKLRGEFKT